jgi:hypothetical protein
MKPFKHSTGRWCVQFGVKTLGRREMRYYDTESAALADIRRVEKERKEHGKATVTADERASVHFLRSQIGNLGDLPEIIAHWKATGSGSVQATPVERAVDAFLAHQLPQVRERTQSDIRSRLKAFCRVFQGRMMHSIHSGDIETWLHSYTKPWTRRSYWKRILPLFAYALRHRMIAENPLELLESPKTKRVASKVYTPAQFVSMLEWSQAKSYDVMLPFLALSGLCFIRTAELVRLYSREQVMHWSDILWDRRLVHVRPEVAKETRRENDERFPPFGESFERVMLSHIESKATGMIVPMLHSEFSKLWRRLHSETGIKPIRNGMRKSCISYTLAAMPELGIVKAATYAGSSEATVKKFYLERLTQADGEAWFNLPHLF